MDTDSIIIGRFAPPDFKVLSNRLERASVHFDVEFDTSPPDTNDQGFFSERATITLTVRTKEAAVAAARVVDEWCLEMGHVKRKNA